MVIRSDLGLRSWFFFVAFCLDMTKRPLIHIVNRSACRIYFLSSAGSWKTNLPIVNTVGRWAQDISVPSTSNLLSSLGLFINSLLGYIYAIPSSSSIYTSGICYCSIAHSGDTINWDSKNHHPSSSSLYCTNKDNIAYQIIRMYHRYVNSNDFLPLRSWSKGSLIQ